jgi:hypothetical protein
MQEISAGMGVCLTTGTPLDGPGVSGWIGEITAQLPDETSGGGAPECIRGREYLYGVGPPKRTDHGRRVLDLAPGNEMLQQRKPGIIERYIGRGLGLSPRGGERAGQNRRE